MRYLFPNSKKVSNTKLLEVFVRFGVAKVQTQLPLDLEAELSC